ncbi:MAG: DNA polymerase III subunit delta [Blastocatellia bacterium]|nr:DNA polymerase III subunit delta [Blastocatellia bacterium]
MKRSASAGAVKSQSDFYRRIQSNQVSPLYLFEGSEVYLREQALKRLTEVTIEASVRDFNCASISVAQGNLGEALAMAREFPMISTRRVVVVTGFEAISDEKQLELLKDYLREPAETTALVFVSGGLDNRRNISTLLRKSCEVVSFEPLGESAPEWASDYARRAGASLDPATAAYLVGMTGGDLLRLANELDKLMAYAGNGRPITRNDIDALVRYTREHSNFELSDAILESDRKRALRLLDHIFANPAEPPQTLALLILGAIASNYRRMLLAKELMSQNAPNSEVAKAAGMSPYAVTRFNEKVRKFATERIVAGIKRIAQTDVALKSSLATPRLQLELLICELCPVAGVPDDEI